MNNTNIIMTCNSGNALVFVVYIYIYIYIYEQHCVYTSVLNVWKSVKQ